MNAGRSAQNSTPSVTSNPGHDETEGMPSHAASSTFCTLYSPKGTATAQPTAMPMSGDHSRNAKGARNTSPVTVARVAKATAGAASDDVPSGTSFSVSNTIGITVTGISMITVPETTGVKMRRSSESRAASKN